MPALGYRAGSSTTWNDPHHTMGPLYTSGHGAILSIHKVLYWMALQAELFIISDCVRYDHRTLQIPVGVGSSGWGDLSVVATYTTVLRVGVASLVKSKIMRSSDTGDERKRAPPVPSARPKYR